MLFLGSCAGNWDSLQARDRFGWRFGLTWGLTRHTQISSQTRGTRRRVGCCAAATSSLYGVEISTAHL